MLATEGLTGTPPFDESANWHCARVDNRQQVFSLCSDNCAIIYLTDANESGT